MNIVIPEDYQYAVRSLKCFDILKNHQVTIYNDHVKDIDVLVKRFFNADVLVLIRERTEINRELLSGLPNLKLISQTGKISNHLDLKTCTEKGIVVAEGIGSPIAPAELTWSLILNATRKLPQAIEGMKQGRWQINIGSAVNGKLLGIWGYGKIGKRIAKYATAFDVRVMIWGSENSRQAALADGYIVAANKEDFFRSVDILSLHLRLTESTEGIISAKDLAMMKHDALLVNTS